MKRKLFVLKMTCTEIIKTFFTPLDENSFIENYPLIDMVVEFVGSFMGFVVMIESVMV